MEEPTQNMPQPAPEKKKCCSDGGYCYCKGLFALLIIVLVWWAPSWANIAITVLAALILLGAGKCMCKKKK